MNKKKLEQYSLTFAFLGTLFVIWGMLVIMLQIEGEIPSAPFYLKVIADDGFLSVVVPFLIAVFISFRVYIKHFNEMVEREKWAAPREAEEQPEKRLFATNWIYEWKCHDCKQVVRAQVSGFAGDEHFHCPNCGSIYYP